MVETALGWASLFFAGCAGIWALNVWMLIRQRPFRGGVVALQTACYFAVIVALIQGFGSLIPQTRFFFVPTSIVVSVFVLAALVIVVHRRRQFDARTLCWLLGVAAENRLPLDAVMDSYAQERRGEMGTRAALAAANLRRGMPLHEALQAARWNLPIDSMLASRLNYPPDQLAAVLKKESQLASAFRTPANLFLRRLFYLFLLVAVVAVAASMGITRLWPSFTDLTTDYAQLNLTVKALEDDVLRLRWPFFILVALGTLSVLVSLALVLFHTLGWMRWEPPVIRRLTRPFHGAMVLGALAAATGRADSTVQSMRQIAACYPLGYFRRKLQRALRITESGTNLFEGLHRAAIIGREEAQLLQSAERLGNLPWALQEVADATINQWWSRSLLLANVLTGILTLLVAIPIFLVAYALFQTMGNIGHELLY